jgi:nitroreductase
MKKELILEIIQERWSPYSFASTPVEEFKLKAMFEAAGHAPSSRNEQPWLFVYATNQESEHFNEFLGFLEGSNAVWAKDAFALIIVLARTKHAYNGKVNRFAFYDTGMAVSNLLLQGIAFDLYVHQMGGYSSEKVKQHLNLGDDIEPLTIMAVGYLGEGNNISPELMKKDEIRRPRKGVNEIVFKNTLSQPAFPK